MPVCLKVGNVLPVTRNLKHASDDIYHSIFVSLLPYSLRAWVLGGMNVPRQSIV
jgi:hypothetical protein